jgi:GntR family transcriptional regulator / MocR family aminotransferase
MRKSRNRLPPRDLKVDRRSHTPAFRQVYERFRDAIARGILLPGERLPSARSLASQLSMARGTIDLAYGLLSGEGYVVARGAAGTFVAPALAGAIREARRTPMVPRVAKERRPNRIPPVAPFQMGLPALDLFPQKLWNRLTTRRARWLSVYALTATDSIGYAPLREAVASYLAISRGIFCSAEQVVITSGFQGALGLIARTFLQPRDAVWFEDPGYFLARLGLESAGAEVVPVPVDAEGLDVEAGLVRAPRARFAYVTPSHQAPLGVSLSLVRRLALLAWATRTNAWIIEDDYDSEFRYLSRPLPALKSLDESGRVLYVGTFSKVLFPGLRLGYLVVPEAQIDRIRRASGLLYRGCSVLEQAAVTDFMVDGHFARHIKRTRAAYAERRAALAAALGQVFGDQLTIQLQAGGMHLLARLADPRSDRELSELAKARGLAPGALSIWCIDRQLRRNTRGLLLSFTNTPTETAIQSVLHLAQAFES